MESARENRPQPASRTSGRVPVDIPHRHHRALERAHEIARALPDRGLRGIRPDLYGGGGLHPYHQFVHRPNADEQIRCACLTSASRGLRARRRSRGLPSSLAEGVRPAYSGEGDALSRRQSFCMRRRHRERDDRTIRKTRQKVPSGPSSMAQARNRSSARRTAVA